MCDFAGSWPPSQGGNFRCSDQSTKVMQDDTP